MLATLERGRRQEFSETRRLARKLDSPTFREQLRSLSHHHDADIAERARLTLGLCERRTTEG